jgi:hypothetical protein
MLKFNSKHPINTTINTSLCFPDLRSSEGDDYSLQAQLSILDTAACHYFSWLN